MQERRNYTADDAPAEVEEGFEDVGLNDEPKTAPPKKKGLFSRFGDNSNPDVPQEKEERPSSGHHHFNFTGRKRAESKSQGSELKSMSTPTSAKPTTEVS